MLTSELSDAQVMAMHITVSPESHHCVWVGGCLTSGICRCIVQLHG